MLVKLGIYSYNFGYLVNCHLLSLPFHQHHHSFPILPICAYRSHGPATLTAPTYFHQLEAPMSHLKS